MFWPEQYYVSLTDTECHTNVMHVPSCQAQSCASQESTVMPLEQKNTSIYPSTPDVQPKDSPTSTCACTHVHMHKNIQTHKYHLSWTPNARFMVEKTNIFRIGCRQKWRQSRQKYLCIGCKGGLWTPFVFLKLSQTPSDDTCLFYHKLGFMLTTYSTFFLFEDKEPALLEGTHTGFEQCREHT